MYQTLFKQSFINDKWCFPNNYHTTNMGFLTQSNNISESTSLVYHSNKIKKVIFNDPATIIIWNDGTKTIVKCQKGDTYSKELGLAMCFAKKFLGNKGNFNDVFKKYIKES